MTERREAGNEDSDLAGRRIWLIGINYAPDQIGIAPYSTQLAEHLMARGAEIVVTTGMPYYPEYRLAATYRWTLSRQEDINGVRVRRLRHSVPHRMTAIRRAVHEATFLGHVLLRRPPFAPDVIIGVAPALSGSVAAAQEARRLGVPLVTITQDLVGPGARQSGIVGGKSLAGVTRRLERWALRQASQVTVLHERFRPYVLGAGVSPDQITVIRNWSYAVAPDASPVEVRRQLDWPTDRPVVLYAGNMGLKMGLANVISAARLAHERDEKILFVLLGGGSQRRMLEAQAAGLPTVRFENSRYGSAFANALAAADVLLINERPSVENMSLPSKLAYYFASGRPVLAATTRGGTTALELERAGAGVVVEPGNPKVLLDGVLDLAADEVRSEALGEAGREYGAREYDRATILRRYEAVIAQALAQSPR